MTGRDLTAIVQDAGIRTDQILPRGGSSLRAPASPSALSGRELGNQQLSLSFHADLVSLFVGLNDLHA